MVGLITQNLSVLPAEAPIRIDETPDGAHVHVPAGCSVSLVEKYDSRREGPYTTQAKFFFTVEPGAHLTHYKLVHEGREGTHHSFLEVDVQKSASFTSH